MKKTLLFILTALAAFCLCIVSCNKDNQPDEMTTDANGEEITTEDLFWRIAGPLVGLDKRTDDYKNATFTPTIGKPDGGDESVRVVATNDLGAAVERYNNLVGANITTETPSHTFSNKAVGTLTWTKGTDGKSWGTVDVSIPQIPSLQRIVYRSPEQGDENGGVKGGGSAYYRFGDVIHRFVSDHEDDVDIDEYWICVRPSFDKEGKGDSHWVCVSPLNYDHVWPYYKKDHKPHVASNGFEYGLPYNLGSDLEWPQDLAEMIFAILYPDQWAFNLQNYYSENWAGMPNGLRMFNDFDAEENIKYHNSAFWKNVQTQWIEKSLFRQIFGLSSEQMAQMVDPDGNGAGLTFLYKGYSWNTVTSNSPKLYEVNYSNSTSDNLKKNMHDQTTRVVQSQVVDPKKTQQSDINYPLDFYTIKDSANPYIIEKRFFGDQIPRWTIRYATGEELSENGKYDAQQPIKGFSETYRYYNDVFPGKNLTDGPEITQEARSRYNCSVHDIIGKDGVFYGSPDEVKAAKTQPAALVVYVGSDADASGKYHGLAMSWEDIDAELPSYLWSNGNLVVCTSSTENNIASWQAQMDGISRTNKLASDSHNHPAATAARNFTMTGFNPAQHEFSGWFLPTAGQFMKAVTAAEGNRAAPKLVYDSSDSSIPYYFTNENQGLYNLKSETEALKFLVTGKYWTSTEYSAERAVFVELNMTPSTFDATGGSRQNKVVSYNKEMSCSIRPFFAF